MAKKLQAVVVLIAAAVIVLIAARYLGQHTVAVLQPRGPIGHQERWLIELAVYLSAIVVLPVFVLLFVIIWKYRASNTEATYTPDVDGNRIIETIWWVIPSIIILILSVVTWRSTHQLDPFRAIASSVKPLNVQVVAMDWKWLFIYPEQHIASVNFVQFPVGTPINFEITSDAPMNSFWIPQLGGQIYAMPGMLTQLHLLADRGGDYGGSSANISGDGFASMRFTARASTNSEFAAWVQSVRQSPKQLDQTSYAALAKPGGNSPIIAYSQTDSELYNSIITKYMVPGVSGRITE